MEESYRQWKRTRYYTRKIAGSMDKDQIIVINLPAGETRMWRQLPDIRGRNSMNRIQQVFENKKAFIPFITAKATRTFP